jgi:hypothetical protein
LNFKFFSPVLNNLLKNKNNNNIIVCCDFFFPWKQVGFITHFEQHLFKAQEVFTLSLFNLIFSLLSYTLFYFALGFGVYITHWIVNLKNIIEEEEE